MRSQSRNDSSPVHKSRNDFAEGRTYLAMRHQNRNDSPHTYQSERDGNADSNHSLRTQDRGDYSCRSPYFVNQHECEFDGNTNHGNDNPSSQTQLQGDMQRTTCSSLYPNGQNRISVNLNDQMFREQGGDGDYRHFMAGNMQYPLTSITYPTQQVSQAYHNDMGYQQATHHGQQKYGGPFQTEFDEPMKMDLSCRPVDRITMNLDQNYRFMMADHSGNHSLCLSTY